MTGILSRLSGAPSLDVDSGQLSVAVMPRASLNAEGYLASCRVLPLQLGEGVDVVRNEDTPACIEVTEGDDLRVPADAEGEWVLVMGDPCYYLTGESDDDSDYGRACAVSLGEEGHGFADLNGGGRVFVSGTVYGDGTYPLHVRSDGFQLLLEDEDDEAPRGRLRMPFDERQALIDRIATLMMDAAISTIVTNPPDIAFDAVTGILFFIGEKAGLSHAQVAEQVRLAAENIPEEDYS
jgi:hypothetical protein